MSISTWEEVKEQLSTSPCNSVLLGNGFSISYKSDDFNQNSIIKEIDFLKDSTEITDVEECIKDTQALVSEGTNKTATKSIIDKWIKENIHKEFIEKLFKKMPATIRDKNDYNEQTLKPYKEFLSNFNSFFTLNYDPLLYWMSLQFISKGDKDVTAVLEQEQKVKTATEGTKTYENAQTRLKEKFGKCVTSIRETIFSTKIKKDNYKMKVFYEDECLFNETLSKVEADKVVSIKKISTSICENMEKAAENNENLKDEFETLESHVKADFDSKKAEIIANNDGIKVNFTDGFLQNSEWSSENEQTAFFLHGAFHILEKDDKVIKIKADPTNTMLKNIKEEWDKGFSSLTILESGHKNKMDEIEQSPYLKFCFDNFQSIKGILVTFGVSFFDSDNHIIDAVNNNPNLEKIYIGCYNDPNTALIEKFKTNDKVFFFSTKGIF